VLTTAVMYVYVTAGAELADEIFAKFLWDVIDDNQTANWQNMDNAQSSNWSGVDNANNPNWQENVT
jgi:hypothetical protein